VHSVSSYKHTKRNKKTANGDRKKLLLTGLLTEHERNELVAEI